MTKKNILISVLIILVLAILAFIIFQTSTSRVPASPAGNQPAGQINNFQIEFLQPAEQASLGISPDLKVQVINRTESGQVQVYRVIKSESDIIRDPEDIGSISPRQVLPEVK